MEIVGLQLPHFNRHKKTICRSWGTGIEMGVSFNRPGFNRHKKMSGATFVQQEKSTGILHRVQY